VTSPTIALGTTPIAGAFLAEHAERLGLSPVAVKPIHRAFRPMVEDSAFDICELAIVTAIQAIDAGRPIIPLPITVSARLQHRCIVQNANFTAIGPQDLPGKRVAVRAYSQTTGAWVRTILDTEYGIDPASITWVTQEAPHVVGAPEPGNVVRDPDGTAAFELLRDGKVDAAIFGNDMPKDDWVRPVIADPDATALGSLARTGVVQINHILAVTGPLAERNPALVRALAMAFGAAKTQVPDDGPDLLPMGVAAMRPSVETFLGSVHRQGLTTRAMNFEDVFGQGAALIG